MHVVAQQRRMSDEGQITLDQGQIWALIEREANILGLSASEAVARLSQGKAGNEYIWSDIASLYQLLSE